MAKPNYQFEKRSREMAQKKKKEEKRLRKLQENFLKAHSHWMKLEQVISGFDRRSGDFRANIFTRVKLKFQIAIWQEPGVLDSIDLCNNGEQVIRLPLHSQDYMLFTDQAGLQILGSIFSDDASLINYQNTIT